MITKYEIDRFKTGRQRIYTIACSNSQARGYARELRRAGWRRISLYRIEGEVHVTGWWTP